MIGCTRGDDMPHKKPMRGQRAKTNKETEKKRKKKEKDNGVTYK